jgi:hypothetical protein
MWRACTPSPVTQHVVDALLPHALPTLTEVLTIIVTFGVFGVYELHESVRVAPGGGASSMRAPRALHASTDTRRAESNAHSEGELGQNDPAGQ